MPTIVARIIVAMLPFGLLSSGTVIQSGAMTGSALLSRLPAAIDKIVVRLLRDHDRSRLLRRYFAARHGIVIGRYSFGGFDRWRMSAGTRIGRYCSIATTARIIDANHPMDALSTHPAFYLKTWGLTGEDRVSAAPIIIEDDVWIGHHAVVLPGCKRIGRGAVIGAGAVVTQDVPRYAVVAGVPARPIRFRFTPEAREAIEATRWWQHDVDALSAAARTVPAFLVAPTAGDAARFAEALRAAGEGRR